MNLSELAKKYGSDKGDVGHKYTEVYEKYFEPLKDKKINFFEIGLSLFKMYKIDDKINKDVPTSLKIWLDYFSDVDVYGFDIKDFSFVEYPRTTIYRGDQSDSNSIKKFIEENPVKFDVIVDDGSHVSKHQQLSLEYLFSRVKKDGYYFIEDLYITFSYDKIESGIRTIDLLKKWQKGDWYNPGMNESNFNYLKEHIGSIKLECNNRLAIITKK